DSVSPETSPLRGFVYVARIPPAPFPPPPHFTVRLCCDAAWSFGSFGSIDSVSPETLFGRARLCRAAGGSRLGSTESRPTTHPSGLPLCRLFQLTALIS